MRTAFLAQFAVVFLLAGSAFSQTAGQISLQCAFPAAPQAGEQFAVLHAWKLLLQEADRLLKVRSDYNQMRIALKDDYKAGVVPDERHLRVMILLVAKKFDQLKFAWIPRRRNQEDHCLARKAVLQRAPVVREDVQRSFESGGIS